LDADRCSLLEQDFFVRGCIEIPILGSEEPLIWGVWVSLSRENFEREMLLANRLERMKEPPYFGWHSSRIPVYPDTFLLKTRLHSREVGLRPYVQLDRLTTHLRWSSATASLMSASQRSPIKWNTIGTTRSGTRIATTGTPCRPQTARKISDNASKTAFLETTPTTFQGWMLCQNATLRPLKVTPPDSAITRRPGAEESFQGRRDGAECRPSRRRGGRITRLRRRVERGTRGCQTGEHRFAG
jgi:hypothetical protein